MTAKEKISELHAKYYGKKKQPAKKETDRDIALRRCPELKGSPKEGIVMHAGATRNELMLEAKNRGVKNFRVLNKQELTDILADIGNQKHIDTIVAGAVTRWKAGWGKHGSRI